MAWPETIRTAFRALNARKMRSLLTVLGILIGVTSVILTVGLGEGAQKSITEQINALGTNLVVVSPRGGAGSSAAILTLADAAMLADPAVVPHTAGVAPVSTTSATSLVGGTSWGTTVHGTTPDWLLLRAQTIDTGRFFTTADVDAAAPVAVIGSTVAEELFEGADPLGQTLTLNGQGLTIVGVLEASGTSFGQDPDNQVVVPLTTFSSRFATASGGGGLSTIYLQAAGSETISAAVQESTTALLSAHRVTADTQDFSVTTNASLVSTTSSLTGILTALLAGIAGISLVVGGIGVMNIMLVSVSERVREIGLRKALGATPSVIRSQFLVEAAMLGLSGGVLGLVLGALGAMALTPLLGFQIGVSPGATALAIGVSLTIGLVAGVYPASRAARLAPIDALRSE